MAVYKDDKHYSNSLVVGVEEGQEGRIVTCMVAADSKNDKKAALRNFKKIVSGSTKVLYLWAGQSKRLRPATERRASTTDASLHSVGSSRITQEGNDVKYSVKKEQPRTVSRQELHSLAEDIVPIKVEKNYRSDAYKMYNRKANVAFTHAQGVSSELNGIVAMYVDNNKQVYKNYNRLYFLRKC